MKKINTKNEYRKLIQKNLEINTEKDLENEQIQSSEIVTEVERKF